MVGWSVRQRLFPWGTVLIEGGPLVQAHLKVRQARLADVQATLQNPDSHTDTLSPKHPTHKQPFSPLQMEDDANIKSSPLS